MDQNKAAGTHDEQERNMRMTRKLSALEENFLEFIGGRDEKFEPQLEADDERAVAGAGGGAGGERVPLSAIKMIGIASRTRGAQSRKGSSDEADLDASVAAIAARQLQGASNNNNNNNKKASFESYVMALEKAPHASVSPGTQMHRNKTIGDFVMDTLNNKPVRRKGAQARTVPSRKASAQPDDASVSHQNFVHPPDAAQNSSQNLSDDGDLNSVVPPTANVMDAEESKAVSHAPSSRASNAPVPQRLPIAKRVVKAAASKTGGAAAGTGSAATAKAKKWTNSHSFQERPNTLHKKWDERETNTFYKLLEKLGTDFTMIQQFLKTKTVTQIKNKFNKEERENPEKIAELLHNPGRKVANKASRLDNEKLQRLRKHLADKFTNQGGAVAAGDADNGDLEELPEIRMHSLTAARKDSVTSVDSVHRLIEENVLNIYNEERKVYNENLRTRKIERQLKLQDAQLQLQALPPTQSALPPLQPLQKPPSSSSRSAKSHAATPMSRQGSMQLRHRPSQNASHTKIEVDNNEFDDKGDV